LTPVIPGCAVVNLSRLNQIKLIDRQLGLITLQPGVTQQQLWEYLRSQALELMVPVHGGGPSCSLLGNALERGYGLTPVTDHYSALTALRAVLPDGTVYQSPFHALGAPLIGSAHRWGVGPYLEGLFSQGNFGIVTEGTFTLTRLPQHTESFFLRIADLKQLGQTVEALREVLDSLPGFVSGMNLMNNRRLLSMTCSYPRAELKAGEIMPDQLCRELSSRAGISDWTLAGVVHCPFRLRRRIRGEIKRLLPTSIGRPIFMNRRRVGAARSVMKWLPIGRKSILQQMDSIESLLDLSEGKPRRIALPLAYWLDGEESTKNQQELDPARDGCGLIWYSPLVPMKEKDVGAYVSMVERVCKSHRIEPLITLTTLSERLFDSTVPILYRPEEPGAVERAHACYEELFTAGGQLGYLPYRVGTTAMQRMTTGETDSHWHLVKLLKNAVDPSHLISPGRYCPTSEISDA